MNGKLSENIIIQWQSLEMQVRGCAAVALSFALGLKLPPASSSQGWCHPGPFSKAPLQIQALMGAVPKQADVLEELLSDFCLFLPRAAEGGQSSGQFQGRPSEVWSQWQSQHHNQQSGDQHSHPQPNQTEVFQDMLPMPGDPTQGTGNYNIEDFADLGMFPPFSE
ncbi:hypothetical protein DV515_00006399 [Chloebia gouldiae]|uniref:Uncharacterized protein n=1 Tax=Chloebia gouldiae TaxID=44316 RepID=A0A3L8SKY8_CHLGU|nr:hypothetical protein DV515_00006399 [Chloebia gouldiae]